MKQDYEIKPLEKQYKLSASKINLWLECPTHYFFHYRTTLEKKEIIWPGNLFGQALHQVVEDLTKDRKKLLKVFLKTDDVNSILKITPSFKEIFDKLLIEHKKNFKKSRAYDYDEFVAKGEKFKKILSNFYLRYFHQEEIISEQELTAEWDKDIILTGFLDLFLKDKKRIYIADLKTTVDSSKFYSMPWAENIQSIIYNYLTEKIYGQYPDAFSFVVLNHEEKSLFIKEKEFSPEQYKEHLKYLSSIINKIKKFNKIKDLKQIKEYRTGACQWCEYKQFCDNLGGK